MKLLILDNEIIRRGAQMFGQHFKKQLNDTGHVCKRVFLYSPEDETSLLPLDDDDRLLKGDKSNFLEIIPSFQPWLCRLIAGHIHAFDPDVVLLNGARSVKYGSIVKRFYYRGNAPFVVRVIDSVVYWNRSMVRQWYSRHVITPQIEGAVGVGAKALQDYRSLYRYNGPGVSIPRSFDFQSFSNDKTRNQIRKRFQAAPSEKIVLFLGNITRQKRPDRFLRVFAEVRKYIPEAVAWVVGDGELGAEMQRQVSELGLGGSVRFFGYQSDVEPFIVASDVLLISSDSEGVPGSAVEAHYLERPVVATNAGDVAMVVQNDVSGYINEIDDETGLEVNVVDLLSRPDKAERFGKQGKAHVVANFNLADITERYLAFFDDIIRNKQRQGQDAY
ncbi:glycosyltransferase family 4 protein [Natronogracilivirga saccharolytica]|uniref:Glycosyltransferase family 4 protein n=1 Tax=Natronogracilivirga saccharolytica TaxID=2812953 RepID=A0A8J7UVY9_9BACT|nr:glycosyltransferase family 4 protein [Natronogracilivirga saccharolytica]MBP3193940.1 glycosyltransferase family 4 protein [Natronogracilivirga saccharolytica]